VDQQRTREKLNKTKGKGKKKGKETGTTGKPKETKEDGSLKLTQKRQKGSRKEQRGGGMSMGNGNLE